MNEIGVAKREGGDREDRRPLGDAIDPTPSTPVVRPKRVEGARPPSKFPFRPRVARLGEFDRGGRPDRGDRVFRGEWRNRIRSWRVRKQCQQDSRSRPGGNLSRHHRRAGSPDRRRGSDNVAARPKPPRLRKRLSAGSNLPQFPSIAWRAVPNKRTRPVSTSVQGGDRDIRSWTFLPVENRCA